MRREKLEMQKNYKAEGLVMGMQEVTVVEKMDASHMESVSR